VTVFHFANAVISVHSASGYTDLTIENWLIKLSRLVESSIIVRMLYKDLY